MNCEMLIIIDIKSWKMKWRVNNVKQSWHEMTKLDITSNIFLKSADVSLLKTNNFCFVIFISKSFHLSQGLDVWVWLCVYVCVGVFCLGH